MDSCAGMYALLLWTLLSTDTQRVGFGLPPFHVPYLWQSAPEQAVHCGGRCCRAGCAAAQPAPQRQAL